MNKAKIRQKKPQTSCKNSLINSEFELFDLTKVVSTTIILKSFQNQN